ncbi:MAG: hypothetical protein KAY13_02820 [Zoogloea sp.]|nr:hypothetical protein [Zoogloea sp.]
MATGAAAERCLADVLQPAAPSEPAGEPVLLEEELALLAEEPVRLVEEPVQLVEEQVQLEDEPVLLRGQPGLPGIELIHLEGPSVFLSLESVFPGAIPVSLSGKPMRQKDEPV